MAEVLRLRAKPPTKRLSTGFALLLMTSFGSLAEPMKDWQMIESALGKMVPFEKTRSAQGRYVAAWSVCPLKKGARPVDWALWTSGSLEQFWSTYDAEPDDRLSAYGLSNYLIDTRSQHAIELKTDWPDFSGKNRGYIATAYSDRSPAPPFALIQNDARFYNYNLWLVALAKQPTTAMDLIPALTKSVRPVLREKSPLFARNYEIFYPLRSEDYDGDVGSVVFRKDRVVIPFLADIPKSMSQPTIKGQVIVALPTGKVQDVRCDAPRDDPFQDDPALKEADARLNEVYAKVRAGLSCRERELLKKAQLDWIEFRNDHAVQAGDDAESDHADGRSLRNKSLLDETELRIARLRQGW